MSKPNSIIISRSSACISFWLDNSRNNSVSFELETYTHLDVYIKCINALHRRGLKLKEDPYYKKSYAILSKYHKYGEWHGLECKTEIFPNGFRFEFYQNINTGDREPGNGYYCSDKYALMPYLIKKRAEIIWSIVLETVKKSDPDIIVKHTDLPALSEQAILSHCHDNHWRKFSPTSLSQIGETVKEYTKNYGNFSDRDKKPIECGQVKYFRNWNGRIYRGTVYHNINNMWWVRINKYSYTNVASFKLFDLTPKDLSCRRMKEGKIPDAKAKELEFMNSLSTGKLQHYLRKKQRA